MQLLPLSWLRGRTGFSLIEAVIAIGVGGLVIAIVAQTATRTITMLMKYADDREAVEIRGRLRAQVDCTKTLAPHLNAAGIVPPGTTVTLVNRSNRALTSTPGSAPAGIFIGSAPIQGRWFLRAFWNGTSLETRIALKMPNSWAATPDPIFGGTVVMDFNSRINPIFGDPAAYRLCSPEETPDILTGYIPTSFWNLYYDPTQGLPGMSDIYYINGSSGISSHRYVINTACKRMCVTRGWGTGWLSESSSLDASGNTQLPPITQYAGCSCAR